MPRTRCPICGFLLSEHVLAKHLPGFFRCPQCSGYYHLESGKPPYPERYFSERNSVSLGQRVLSLFLFFRAQKIKRILADSGARILDYGSGDGRLVSYLNSRGFHADGYDPSEAAVSLARKNNIPVYGSIPARQYDLIMFWHSLEHSDTPLNDIIACKEYCAPSARLLIAVPNAYSLEAKISGKTWFCYDWPFHRVHFTPRALKVLLEKAGFKIASIDYLNPEYTLSSLAQTFLNLFLPKNVFYGLMTARRSDRSRGAMLAWGLVSFGVLVLFSPFLLLVFAAELMTKKTAAFVVVAQKNS